MFPVFTRRPSRTPTGALRYTERDDWDFNLQSENQGRVADRVRETGLDGMWIAEDDKQRGRRAHWGVLFLDSWAGHPKRSRTMPGVIARRP